MILMQVGRQPLKDPETLAGFELDDYAASWQRRLGLERGTFQRDHAEPDKAYRPRLLKMIRETIEFA